MKEAVVRAINRLIQAIIFLPEDTSEIVKNMMYDALEDMIGLYQEYTTIN